MLAEHSAVPFHLAITEPIDESVMTDYPAVEGSYDPVAQIWQMPTGTAPPPVPFTFTHCFIQGSQIIDDGMVD
jgi:hypothetical protein